MKSVAIAVDLLRATNKDPQPRVQTQSGEGGGGYLEGLWALVAHLWQPAPPQQHLLLSPLRLVPLDGARARVKVEICASARGHKVIRAEQWAGRRT